jgi:hypothetical protein
MKLRAFDVAFRAVQRGYTLDEIRPCLTQDLGGGFFEVDVDHAAYPRVARDGYTMPTGAMDAAKAMLVKLGIAQPDPSVRPGRELKAILKDWLGIEATPTCSCNAMAQTMDERGPEWCEGDGMASILEVMRNEHAKRWADGATILPWTDFAARKLVMLACKRARVAVAPENKG